MQRFVMQSLACRVVARLRTQTELVLGRGSGKKCVVSVVQSQDVALEAGLD